MTNEYVISQLASAFLTATTHEDAVTRRRAEKRLRKWHNVLKGMADGTLVIGSRTPVAGLPAWVTPEVVRGGFATGAPAAKAGKGGAARFAHFLTEQGMAELWALLDSGRYRIGLPEEAALLVVAWLLRQGHRAAAMELVDTLWPFANRLRFTPVPAAEPMGDPEIMWRETAGQARETVAARKPRPQIEAMREALTVWNPFSDELVTLWQETTDFRGLVATSLPPGWLDRAAAVLVRYRTMAATHTLCGKHRNPKENLGIMVSSLQAVLAGELTLRLVRLLQHAVDSIVRRREETGSAGHAALRDRQAADAALPTHVALARVVASRLTEYPADAGIPDVAPVLRDAEGVPVPESIARTVRRAQAGTAEHLIETGVVVSAETLADLSPQLSAAAVSRSYADPALQTLMGAHYRAFRNRRSLLLLNLEHQVRVEELPWVQAAAGAAGISNDDTRAQAWRTLSRLAGLTMNAFPATVLPNPMISELAALSEQAEMDVPWVEELAADIFMGTFSGKFLRAAKMAGEYLSGTLYERYYGIDYAAIAGVSAPDAFGALCHQRSGAPRGGYSVAANGMVIEQEQILTTHNLVTLVSQVGVTATDGWPELAHRCLHRTLTGAERFLADPRPLRAIKDAAYAWRQMVFFLAQSVPVEQFAFIEAGFAELGSRREAARVAMTPVLAGLAHVAAGGSFDASGQAGHARRFLGWTTDRHWILPHDRARGTRR